MAANDKGTRSITRKVLTLKESLAIDRIVRARYTVSGLESGEFALSVNMESEESKSFRFPLNAAHIRTAIAGADIPSNTARRAKRDDVGECLGLTARVQELEEQMKKLTATVMNLGKFK